jgi:hypothetical protein
MTDQNEAGRPRLTSQSCHGDSDVIDAHGFGRVFEELLAAAKTGKSEGPALLFLSHCRIELQGSDARFFDHSEVHAPTRIGNNVLKQTGGMVRAVSVNREGWPTPGSLQQEDNGLWLVVVGQIDTNLPSRTRDGVLGPRTARCD